MPAAASTRAGHLRPLLLLGSLGGLLAAVTVGLWVYYGTAVFFEIVRAGWIACF